MINACEGKCSLVERELFIIQQTKPRNLTIHRGQMGTHRLVRKG